MKTLFVGGNFGTGRPSKIVQTIHEATGSTTYHNGGPYNQLESILDTVDQYGLIYWFPDIPNDKPKLVSEIKKRSKCVLVTSKRNDGKYSLNDVIQHALKIKSNLLVEFTKQERYRARILDPLGNIFADSEDFKEIGAKLKQRTSELLSYTRLPSTRICDAIPVPNDEAFFKVIKEQAEVFHRIIQAANPTRLLGNASFRCERGFPSMRKGNNMIYVSRRNIDKRYIGREGFVAVLPKLPVRYFGDHKPSVDTPIQLGLYRHFRNVNYMLHGHVYVKDAPFTENIVPCGAVEELDEIKKLFPEDAVNFAVNLRGHGSLVLADNPEYLRAEWRERNGR